MAADTSHPVAEPLRRRTAAHVALPEDLDSPRSQFLNASKRGARCDSSDAAQRARLRDRFDHVGAGSAAPTTGSHRAPPTLGQHNREVLGELGFGEAELARWEREDIIGTQPAWLRAKQGEET